jgi:hypothetical protein
MSVWSEIVRSASSAQDILRRLHKMGATH